MSNADDQSDSETLVKEVLAKNLGAKIFAFVALIIAASITLVSTGHSTFARLLCFAGVAGLFWFLGLFSTDDIQVEAEDPDLDERYAFYDPETDDEDQKSRVEEINSLYDKVWPQTKPEEIWLKTINEQRENIAQILAAANGANGNLADNLNKMISLLAKVERHLESDTSGFSHVQRLFTYYVPQTANLLSARGAALRFDDDAKVTEIDNVIERLCQAYEEYSMRLWGMSAQELKIDLQLLEQSLNAEFPIKEKI